MALIKLNKDILTLLKTQFYWSKMTTMRNQCMMVITNKLLSYAFK